MAVLVAAFLLGLVFFFFGAVLTFDIKWTRSWLFGRSGREGYFESVPASRFYVRFVGMFLLVGGVLALGAAVAGAAVRVF